MRIIEEYNTEPVDLIKIKSAKYIGDFAIRLFFNDGSNRLFDFKPFLESSFHPTIRKYLNEDLFRQFSILDGYLDWNDYELCFPIWDLYKGEL